MASVVVIFDFDKTIIDCDSDNWVIDELGGTQRFDDLLQIMPWNSALDKIMSEIQAQGKSVEEIAATLRRAPLDPYTAAAIKSASALGCELRIVSDANLFFIETVLQHHGLMSYFSEINTNPSRIEHHKKLRISPFVNFISSPHGCTTGFCPPNMCKGLIMKRIQDTVLSEGKKNKKKRFIYLGDGKGDFCPSLKLSKDDYLMPRKNYPLWELLMSNNGDAVQAQVHEWSNGEELERVLLTLINMAVAGEDNGDVSQVISMDCKLHTLPSAAATSYGKAVPQALPVGL